jgi:hypothetical protein
VELTEDLQSLHVGRSASPQSIEIVPAELRLDLRKPHTATFGHELLDGGAQFARWILGGMKHFFVRAARSEYAL